MGSKVAVYIAGYGVVSSLGFSVSETVDNIANGITGIKPLTNKAFSPYDIQAAYLNNSNLTLAIEQNNLTNYSVFEAIIIISVKEALSKCNIEISNNTLFVLSTTKGNIEALKLDNICDDVFLWKSAENIAKYFGMNPKPVTVSNACVSGIAAVEFAARMLGAGQYQNAVVAGGDMLSAFTVSGFLSFKSLSEKPCKPYDINRDGLTLGEGAAALVLTTNALQSYAGLNICGGAITNDANHISGPSRTGKGLYNAITKALCGIDKNNFNFACLHGTATIFNDESECKAISSAGLQNLSVMGLKGYLGHTLGASGLMELAICAEALKRGEIFATKGFSKLGVTEPMDVTFKNEVKPIHSFLKTASGFGGVNAAITVSNLDNGGCYGFANSNGVLITSNCKIFDNAVYVNNNKVFASDEPFGNFIKSAFKNVASEVYPKFSKMDSMSKLAITAVEYLLKNSDFVQKYGGENIALVFCNSSSSLDTDIRHLESITHSYLPSPSVFVYTLPNICLGEIAIKHNIQGETMFFVLPQFDKTLIEKYSEILLCTGKAKAVIGGYVDYLKGKYSAELFCIEKNE